MEVQAKIKGEQVAVAPGYKRELIRIIANMVYKNTRNQDEVCITSKRPTLRQQQTTLTLANYAFRYES